MTTPATPGDHIIVTAARRPRLTWTGAIIGTAIAALLVAVAHLSHFGPGIDKPVAVIAAIKTLCDTQQGVRRVTLRPRPDHYTVHCRDGSVYNDVKVTLGDT